MVACLDITSGESGFKVAGSTLMQEGRKVILAYPVKMNQWIFSDKEMTKTPSILAGSSIENETTTRMRACRFIHRCGNLLSL